MHLSLDRVLIVLSVVLAIYGGVRSDNRATEAIAIAVILLAVAMLI